MELSRKEKQQIGQLVSFVLLIIISLFLISKLNELLFNILGSVSFIGQESAQRIREASSISIPQLLIDHYELPLSIFLIGAYLFLKYKPQRKRRW